MTSRSRLTAYLSRFLAAAPAAGCVFTTPPHSGDTGVVLDDIACLSVALGDPCPDASLATSQLVGTQTCESPVREVVATGAFVSSENVQYTGYGGWVPYDSADTGGGTGSWADPANRCCYEASYITHPNMSCTIGRPLVVDGHPISAGGAWRADWCDALAPEVSDLDDRARTALAAAWTEAGLMEHASVPAFARVLLELVALGAPSSLIERTTAAIADEIAHARACFALASAYAGRPVGPGRLDAPAKAAPNLVSLAVEAFREGCVGETLAVGLAAAQLREAADPAVVAVLERIVHDEAEHAALAWDTVRWAIDVGGDEVRHAVAAALATIDPDELGADRVPGPAEACQHGIVDPRNAREALLGVYHDVIAPCATELLAA